MPLPTPHATARRPAAPGAVAGAVAGADSDAHRLRVAVGRLGRRLRQARGGTELSPSQYEVLASVVTRGPLRLSELAELEALNPTMLSRIVGVLERDGLVRRSQDARDARIAHLEATGSGRRLVGRVRAERDDSVARLLATLDDGQRRKLSAALPALEALAEAARPSTGAAGPADPAAPGVRRPGGPAR